MRKKWRDARGETLVEVLTSILIGALSVALLFGAVMASGNMDRTAQNTDDEFYRSLKAAEEQEAAVTDTGIVSQSEVSVTKKGEGPAWPGISVQFYGGRGALSYALSP